jgi:AcrR family transcriptional regulator
VVDGRAARWIGHRDRRRAEFVTAAVRAIERLGPSATVDQIAAEAGVSRQVLYRQFEDRRDLDRSIAEHAATLLVEHLTPVLGLDVGIESGVRRAVAAYLDFIGAHIALYRFVRSRESDAGPDAVRRVKDTITDAVTVLARAVVDIPADTHAALADTTAIALVGMADSVIAAWLDEPRGLARNQLLEQLVQLAVGLIRAALNADHAGVGGAEPTGSSNRSSSPTVVGWGRSMRS